MGCHPASDAALPRKTIGPLLWSSAVRKQRPQSRRLRGTSGNRRAGGNIGGDVELAHSEELRAVGRGGEEGCVSGLDD